MEISRQVLINAARENSGAAQNRTEENTGFRDVFAKATMPSASTPGVKTLTPGPLRLASLPNATPSYAASYASINRFLTSLPSSAPPRASNYTVKTGDTMSGIAKKLLEASGQDASPQAAMRAAYRLARANNIENPDRIKPGQQLNLAGFATEGTQQTLSRPPSRTEALAAPRKVLAVDQASKGAPANIIMERTLDRAVALGYVDPSQKDAVREKILSLSTEHRFAPDDLATVMLMESDGMNPRASNGHCHGIIQFCDGPNRGAASVGFASNPKGILELGVLDQLDLVGKYLDETGLRKIGPATLDNLYLTVLTPAARAERDPNAKLDIQGPQATLLHEGGNREGPITRMSILTGLWRNAQQKLAMALPHPTRDAVRVSALDTNATTRLR